MKVTFIGLGIMGSRMAHNLLNNQVDLTVYNRSEAPADALAEKGAKKATTIEEAVAEADIVFTMLAHPEAVSAVMLEKGLKAMQAKAYWIDCSTVNPSFSMASAKAADANQVNFLDAPVAGTKPQAQEGSLTFFLGGKQEETSSIEPILKHMGNKVLYFDEVSKGTSFKMLVNALLAQSMVMFAEAVILGEKMGLPRSLLLDMLPNLPVVAPFTKAKAGMMKQHNFDVLIPLELMNKDIHLATLTAYETHQPLY
ncbi:MAG: NAD(P)-dependent oxidoreductase [Thermonemataceae bacterium]